MNGRDGPAEDKRIPEWFKSERTCLRVALRRGERLAGDTIAAPVAMETERRTRRRPERVRGRRGAAAGREVWERGRQEQEDWSTSLFVLVIQASAWRTRLIIPDSLSASVYIQRGSAHCHQKINIFWKDFFSHIHLTFRWRSRLWAEKPASFQTKPLTLIKLIRVWAF